jgi:hypothetical protein
MNPKRFLILLCTALFSLAVVAPNGWAGSPQQHRLEGIAIGIGALILGKALVDAHQNGHFEARVAAYQTDYPEHHRPRGHWESRRVWVPAKYKKAWNPGHHNRHGRWVPGQWRRTEIQPGHWINQRVRVGHH